MFDNLTALVNSYVTYCIALETPPRVSELAARAGVSTVTLNSRMKAEFGTCPGAYLKAAQLSYARHLLMTTDLTTTAIAYAAGFGTRRTFYRCFLRVGRMTPASFRERAQRKHRQEHSALSE